MHEILGEGVKNEERKIPITRSGNIALPDK